MSDDRMSAIGVTASAASPLVAAGTPTDGAGAREEFGHALDAELAGIGAAPCADAKPGGKPGPTTDEDADAPPSHPSPALDPLAVALAMSTVAMPLPHEPYVAAQSERTLPSSNATPSAPTSPIAAREPGEPSPDVVRKGAGPLPELPLRTAAPEARAPSAVTIPASMIATASPVLSTAPAPARSAPALPLPLAHATPPASARSPEPQTSSPDPAASPSPPSTPRASASRAGISAAPPQPLLAAPPPPAPPVPITTTTTATRAPASSPDPHVAASAARPASVVAANVSPEAATPEPFAIPAAASLTAAVPAPPSVLSAIDAAPSPTPDATTPSVAPSLVLPSAAPLPSAPLATSALPPAAAAPVAIDPRAASSPRFRITPRDVARSADRAFAPDAVTHGGAPARSPEAVTARLVDTTHRAPAAPHEAIATIAAAARATTTTPGARAELLISTEPTPEPTPAATTPSIATGEDAAAPLATPAAAGMPSVSDGALTIVTAPAGSRKPAGPSAPVDADSTPGIRERGRAAATGAADHRAIANGIHAEVDLGEAGRVLVHADKMDGSRVDVRLDADVAQTARALTENARDLAMDLRTDAREARVTVSGPGTQSVSTSTDGGASGGASHRERHGDAASSRREENREPRDGSAHGNGAADRDAGARVSRRARFVL